MATKGIVQFMFGAEAREYFAKIENNSDSGKFKILLQKYWLCAQIGLLYGVKENPVDTKHVANNIAPPLKGEAHNIRALAFYRFIRAETFDTDSKQDMLKAMNAFFDDEIPHKLSPRALRVIDDYAQGGFEKIRDTIKNPVDLAGFLCDYTDLLLKGKNLLS